MVDCQPQQYLKAHIIMASDENKMQQKKIKQNHHLQFNAGQFLHPPRQTKKNKNI